MSGRARIAGAVDRYVDELLHDLNHGLDVGALPAEHADRLERADTPVRVLALEPCPRCGGTILAGDTTARCAAGCDWTPRP